MVSQYLHWEELHKGERSYRADRILTVPLILLIFQVGDLIALTVEEGQDWKDVQIPAVKSTPSAAASAAAPLPVATAVTSVEAVDLHFIPGIGPATNLLLAQYGLDAR